MIGRAGARPRPGHAAPAACGVARVGTRPRRHQTGSARPTSRCSGEPA